MTHDTGHDSTGEPTDTPRLGHAVIANELLFDPTVSTNAKLVHMVETSYGERVTIGMISAALGIDNRQVMRALDELIHLGIS